MENESKGAASRLLTKAREVTGTRKPEDKPDLLSSFGLFPDKLEAIDERLHDLSAQAEICAGTDTQVAE